jgi:hypothetical protein
VSEQAAEGGERAGGPGGESAAAGSVAEEATRLFEAVQDWVRRTTDDPGPRIATGSPECTVCPLCQGLALLRSARPETFAHLAEAMAALAAAGRDLLESHAGHGDPHRRSGRPDVERIDVL